jgi:hypothetical protein
MVIKKHNNELLVVWKDPITRNRIVIGRLWKRDAKYYFKYIHTEENERGSIEIAVKMGYQPIKIFENIYKIYKANNLFAPFLNRLSGQDRKNKPFDQLRETGGRLSTDTLEFIEPINEIKKERKVSFNIAGWRHYQGDQIIDNFLPDDSLLLKLEDDNLYDNHAIEIWTKDSKYKLGYVPAVYSRYIDQSVKENKYEAIIKEISPNAGSDEKVKIEFCGEMVKPVISKEKVVIV